LNAGTQNLTSVLTAGNTTGNFHISHADNYGDIYNGNGGEEWVVACDPIQFSSTATNDLYLASNAIDNFVRMGSYSGSVFSESGRIGSIGTGEKRAIFAGTLNALCIEDNAPAPSKGTSGQFLSCGTGGSLLWASAGGGGAGTLDQTLALGNTATGAYANITLTDTSAGGILNPIMTLVNTEANNTSVGLEVYKNKGTAGTAGDTLFQQSVYGKDSGNAKQEYTRITHTIRDATASSEDGSMELSCFTAGGIATFLQLNGVEGEVNCLKTLDMGGNNISSSSGSMTITTASSTGLGNITQTAKAGVQITGSNGVVNLNSTASTIGLTASTGISQTATTGTITLSATAGAIELNAGSSSGIQTNQITGVRSILRTGYTNAYSQNLDYQPSYVVENSGLTTNISLPYMPYQTLTIMNTGISPTFNWGDVGSVMPTQSPTAFIIASSGAVWVGVNQSIRVYADTNFADPPLFVYDLTGGGDVECFHEAQGFMFVGGDFAGLATEPTPQFNLLRFAGAGTLTPSFDAMYSATGQQGFNGQVYGITSSTTTLYVGGNFSTTFPTAYTLSNLCIVANPYGAGGTQTYTDDFQSGTGQFSTNGIVYAMSYHNNGGVENVYVGGNFTEVAGGFQLIAYGAVYEVGWTSTPFTTLGFGNFNSLINSFSVAVDGVSMLFTGSFNFIENGEAIKYSGYSSLANPFTSPLKSLNIATISASGIVRNGIISRNGYNFIITDDRQVWYGTDTNAWEDGGVAEVSVQYPTGITYDGVSPYVLMPLSTTGVRKGVTSTGSAIFELPSENFRTISGTFSKATLPEYTSQQFIADGTGTLYIPVGTPISTFSN
jgi:hypothetical protein